MVAILEGDPRSIGRDDDRHEHSPDRVYRRGGNAGAGHVVFKLIEFVYRVRLNLQQQHVVFKLDGVRLDEQFVRFDIFVLIFLAQFIVVLFRVVGFDILVE